jgi:hypothetical protein
VVSDRRSDDFAASRPEDEFMNTPASPRVTKYVLIPMPRTDARPRRFRLAPVDDVTRMPTVLTGPGRLRKAG